jgi:NTP pyrophosphatase (non-canonical NTP hydrolase)
VDLEQLSLQVERVSAQYADGHGFRRDAVWFLLKLQEEVGELTQAFLAQTGQARTKGRTPEELNGAVRAELADVLAHVLLLGRHLDVDLPSEVADKWLSWLEPLAHRCS